MKDINRQLTYEIAAFVDNTKAGIWRHPIAGFADIRHPYIRNIRKYAGEKHQMPEEVMPDASAVLVYFLPFREDLVRSNKTGVMASAEWARIYEETNAMFPALNDHLIQTIRRLGYDAAQASEAPVFYRDEISSHWSFRHFAYAAGLGTFGMNNMLITSSGCAGRLNGLVTNIDIAVIETDEPQSEEACLYKRDAKCGLCMKVCPAGAITPESYNRQLCYDQCLKNAEIHTSFGSSYSSGDAQIGSEVCGKCIAGMPCALRRP